MRASAWIAAMTVMSWCESLGDGCVPLFSPAAETEAASTDASDPGGSAEDSASMTGAPTATDETATATTAGPPGTGTTTEAAAAEPTTADGSTTADDPTTCGDADLDPTEPCDTDSVDTDADAAAPLGCGADCQPVRAVDLAAGAAHACVLLSDGRVRCWGDNSQGQLGVDGEAELADVPDIDATEGEVDLEKDVAFADNGRLFAGGATTCVSSAGKATDKRTWCWGQAVGGAGVPPQGMARHYSAMAMRDVTDEYHLTCGLERDGEMHRLACWGQSDGMLAPYGDGAGACGSSIEEDAVTSIGVDLDGAHPQMDAGQTLACWPTGGAMMCAGYDGALCTDDDPVVADKCVTGGTARCPSGCDATPCEVDAIDVALWRGKVCHLPAATPASVECRIDDAPQTFELGPACGTGFTPTEIAVSEPFFCAVERKDGASRVCCDAFGAEPNYAPVFADPVAYVVKAVALDDEVLLLAADGRVFAVGRAPEWGMTAVQLVL